MTTDTTTRDGSTTDDRRAARTAELRSLFERISPVTTFTEPRQADRRRGDVATDAEVDDALRDVLAALRRRIGLDVALDDDDVVRVVRGFYGGDDDATIAATVDGDVDDVVAARLAVGIFRPADLPATVDRPRLAALVDAGATTAETADALGVDPATAERAAGTLLARRRARADGYRARLDAESILSDGGVDLDATVREALRHDRETFDEVRD